VDVLESLGFTVDFPEAQICCGQPAFNSGYRDEARSVRTEVRKSRLERLAFRVFAWLMRHPRAYEMAGRMAAKLAPSSNSGWIGCRTRPP
jgi:hypothetical protein